MTEGLHLKASEKPAKDLFDDEDVAPCIFHRLADPASGKGNDQVCQWLFDMYQTQDVEMQAVVLQYIPTLCGLYLRRVSSRPNEPLAGFEAVLLALYAAETTRGGRPLVINIPNLAQPSLYHSPNFSCTSTVHPHVKELSSASALEPQVAVKSSNRASVVGVALELFCRRIGVMPFKAKLDLCHYARSWAIQGCFWAKEVDATAQLARATPAQGTSVQPTSEWSGEPLSVNEQLSKCTGLSQGSASSPAIRSPPAGTDKFNDIWEFHDLPVSTEGPRVPLEMDLLRPIFKVIAHCLMAPTNSLQVKAAALEAAGALYARASHDMVPEAILASRSLLRMAAAAGGASTVIRPYGSKRVA